MKQLLAAVLLVALGCSSLGGTETGNPDSVLTDFESSACKSKASAPGQQALLSGSSTDGLQCVEWQAKPDGKLQLRLLNFPLPCGEAYLGRAARAPDGTLELDVYKDSCDMFRCGSCVFDFDFQLEVPNDAASSLRFGSAVCASQPTTFDEPLRLPLDTAPQGALCRPLEKGALEQYATSLGRCGEPNMPCGDCQGAGESCAAGTRCSALDDSDSRCLLTCDAQADCEGFGSCVEGVCRADGWR